MVARVGKIMVNSHGLASLYGHEEDHINTLLYVNACRHSMGTTLLEKDNLVAFWSTIFLGYLESIYYPRVARLFPSDFKDCEDISSALAAVVLGMSRNFNHMHNATLSRGFSNTLFGNSSGASLFSTKDRAILEVLSRLLERRSFFSYTRNIPKTSSNLNPRGGSSLIFNAGMCPDTAAEGDLVCVLLGCKVPVVLRPQHEHFSIIGDAYVHDWMHGEAFQSSDSGNLEIREFAIL